jgi:hypothetical protein
MSGVGLLSYNALDVNGSIIGFFTTDNQFVILDPSSGVDYAAFPIGDQLRLNNGNAGTSWDAANVYVAWHVSGEDQGWYICDGANGWFRPMPTPAPESGYTWSPFAAIVGGVGAVQSIEVTPGLHKLLLGPTGTSVQSVTATQLGVAAPYSVLAYSGITNTGSTVITGGSIGSFPTISITGFPPGIATIDQTDAAAAQTALAAAIAYYQGVTPTLSGLSDLSTGGNGSTAATYTPGNYFGSSSLTMPTGIILDAQNNPNATFVFVAGSTINLASGQTVALVNGAQAANVVFVAGSSFTSVATSTVNGSILAVDSITLGGGFLNGRALANTGAVTMAAATAVSTTSTSTSTGTGSILNRDLTTWADNGTNYPANAVIGSAVLAQPGQIAIVGSITTDSVKTGTPLILGVIFDEALPYFTGAFDLIKNWVDDPPNTKKSTSFYSQRFNMSEVDGEAAACRSMQIKVIWNQENSQNELLTMTVYGAFAQES